MTSRNRFKPSQVSAKPALAAGLTLFVRAGGIPDSWVRLVLAAKEVDNARVETIHAHRPNEDFLILNPEGRLPTLANREGVICGAGVIAEYLDERYPHPPLMPLGPARRAQARMHMQTLELELFPAIQAIKPGSLMSSSVRLRLTAAFRGRRLCGGSDYSLLDCGWAALFWELQQLTVALPENVSGLQQYAELVMERANAHKVLSA